MRKSHPFSARIDKLLLTQARVLALKEGVTLTVFVSRALKTEVERCGQERARQMISEALNPESYLEDPRD